MAIKTPDAACMSGLTRASIRIACASSRILPGDLTPKIPLWGGSAWAQGQSDNK